MRPAGPVEPDEPAAEAEPTAEMIGEQWQSPGVPPPRDPAMPWFNSYPLDDAWRELSAPYNHNAALVTFKRAGLERGYFAGKVLISEDELAGARQRLLQVRKVSPLDVPDAAREMPRMPDGRAYPAMVVQIGSREALREIRELDTVEAVEPLFLPLGIGCSLDPYTAIAADGDIFGNRIPWSFSHLGIVEAWNLYKNENDAIYFPGAGIRIGVVDTGVFETEDQLTTEFASIVRPPPLHHTVVSKTWDDCGHGTRIAGLATAPLETQSIMPRKIAGVAWGADLTTVKYNGGVILGAGQATELVAAIKLAVADGARVVNLALGTPFASSFVYDNIDTIYRTTQTIFVGAAGTFVKDVQFPGEDVPAGARGLHREEQGPGQPAGRLRAVRRRGAGVGVWTRGRLRGRQRRRRGAHDRGRPGPGPGRWQLVGHGPPERHHRAGLGQGSNRDPRPGARPAQELGLPEADLRRAGSRPPETAPRSDTAFLTRTSRRAGRAPRPSSGRAWSCRAPRTR